MGGFVNSYSYNANGEQTNRTLSGTSNTLAFDYDGQLSSITQGSAVVSFAYDAAGRRVSRTAGGTATNFQYDGNSVLLEKQGSTTTATYTYGNGLVRKDGEYPMFDGMGSERTVLNSSQTVTGTLTLSAFGQTVATTGSSANPYMFAANSGYRNDGDAGLSHVGARYYDAQTGMFITRDTYLDQMPYLYCEHDPVNHLDPSGHDWKDWPIVRIARTVIALIGQEKETPPFEHPSIPPVRPRIGSPPAGWTPNPKPPFKGIWIPPVLVGFDLMPPWMYDGSILKKQFCPNIDA